MKCFMLLYTGGRRIAVRGELTHGLNPRKVRFISQGLQRLWDDQCEAREQAENFMPVAAPVEARNHVVLLEPVCQFGYEDRMEIHGYREVEVPGSEPGDAAAYSTTTLGFSQVKPRGYRATTMVPAGPWGRP